MKPLPHSVHVLAVSGLLGLRLGWVAFPDWQVAVETAQVVAGIVRYPSATPFFIYHVKLWTILHQLLAIGLRLGASEIRLSLIVSAIVGMLSLQALAIAAYALSGDAFLAVGSALLIYFSRASELGVTYPIYLMGSTDTYGMFGLSLLVLVAGLLGAGCDGAAFFLAGLAPAIHPSLGLWLEVLLGVSLLWDQDALRSRLLPCWKYLLAGSSVTLVSGLVHLAGMRGIRTIDRSVAATYLKSFVEIWDVHRAPVPLASRGVAANGGVCILAVLWLTAFRADLTSSARLFLRFAIVSAVLSLLFALMSWLPPEWLPQSLLILMPSRLLNLDSMMAPAILIGLIGIYRRSRWSAGLILALSAGLMLARDSMLWTWMERHGRSSAGVHTDVMMTLAIASVGLIVMATVRRVRRAPSARSYPIVAIAGRGALAATFVTLAFFAWGVARPQATLFSDRETDPLFRSAAQGRGILLTAANLHLMQLKTRRPVLVDGGGLDGLPYALESAAELDRILRDVYGIDFFHPPDDARRTGQIPRGENQLVWERFTLDDWRRIRRTYGVTDVVTWADWTLALPVEAQNRQLRLYSIPE